MYIDEDLLYILWVVPKVLLLLCDLGTMSGLGKAYLGDRACGIDWVCVGNLLGINQGLSLFRFGILRYTSRITYT